MKYLAIIFFVFMFAATTKAAEIDLLWSADTYMPPFFQGHSAATPGSTVRVAALAPSGAGATGRWQFRWWRNGQFLTQASGAGRDLLTFTVDDNNREEKIVLRLNDQNGQLLTEKTLSIPIGQPRLVLYENSPLTGINYAQAIGAGYTLVKPELALLAEPYYFSRGDAAGKRLEYAWQLNDRKLTANANDGRSVTFGLPSSGGAGENLVTLSVENPNNILQTARRAFNIKFGGASFSF